MKKSKRNIFKEAGLVCCLFVFAYSSFGQKLVKIKGVVKSAQDSSALGWVMVHPISHPKQITVSDSLGNFVIEIPETATKASYQFELVGFTKRVVEVMAGQLQVNVYLTPSAAALNEVVVTALGISRKRQSLGYAVSEVKGSEFTQAKENNVANALTGKVAGVNATGLSTGPGGSSRIIIRGNGSLTGANQPLYVVNGMPIDNTTPGGSPTTNGSTTNSDRGDGIGGINPDDIEAITVLKGGTAAALYGSRAANGVILITTKRGRIQKGIGLDYNSTFMANTPAVFSDWQYEYGQGDGGVKPTDQASAIQTGRRSFGSKIDGSTYVAADGKQHPYSAQKDNIKNFYNTGTDFTNTLAFYGGNKDVTYRFSMMNLESKGIIPNSTFGRKVFNLNVNGHVGEKIIVDALAQYNYETANNRPSAGDALGNPNWTPYMSANTMDIRWLQPGYDASGNEIAWNDAAIASNSYFVVNKYKENDQKNRFIGQLGITYNLLSNLSFRGVISRDFYNYNYTAIVPYGDLYVPYGQYTQLKTDVAETNGMVTGTYKKQFGKDVGLNVLGGVNRRKYEYNELSILGSNFVIPYFYSSTNLSSSSTTPVTQHTETNSAFGSVDLNYKTFAYLTFTGRQDWFSTLSPKNNTIFYPSIGGSLVLSDMIKMPSWVSFFKFRGSWAQVGGATPDPYAINLSFSMIPSSGQPLQGITGATNVVSSSITTAANGGNTTITNANLKPLTSTTTEAGFESQLFNNRLGIDLTYYDRKTTNDIVTTSISGTSGYNYAILNAGELRNSGIELLLTGKMIRNKNFAWNVSYNFAYNDNKVVQLTEGLTQLQMAASVNSYAYINNIVGQPYGSIIGTSKLRDANGNIVYNTTTGLAVASSLHRIGNGVPPTTMGFTNEFRYKNFSLNILVDGKFGNKIFSLTEVYATRLGLMKTTLPGRENGLTLNGVDQSGNTYTRTVPVSGLRTYYDNDKLYTDLFVHDGSFVKLRQVIFSYNIPVSKLSVLKLQSATVSFVARNLLILYKKTDNFDPEQSMSNGAAQGIESFGVPRTRNYGLNLTLKF